MPESPDRSVERGRSPARPGGVRRDIPQEEIPNLLKLLDELEKNNMMLTKAILDDPVIHARTKGVGIFDKAHCRMYGALGPTARSAGSRRWSRRAMPPSGNLPTCVRGST